MQANRKQFIGQFLFRAVLLGLAWGLVACSKMGGGSAKDPNVEYYTCTMHPSVKSQDPKAKCPICSMDLVPVMKKGANGEARHQHEHGSAGAPGSGLSEFMVPVKRQQQIGVTYAAAKN